MNCSSTTEQSPSETTSLSTEPPCLAELERIQIQEAAKKKPGEGLGWIQKRRKGSGALGSPEAQRLQLLGIRKTLSQEESLA